ncbi:GNAT family N-acetyltransferase [Nocardia lijiangensis]|uniref:GNAT family N-acetyltransferase n=1 Tax=Nocardia lijiangensis TaxID=299618 RepID=UPI0009FE1AD2|nr:GNAT family N-acetyltransferase [Nocardia lijiangensis]
MRVYRAAADDWQLVRAVRLEALREARVGVFGSGFEVASAWSEGQWRGWMDRQVLFVAEANDALIGSAGGLLDNGQPSLVSLWVHPSARGTGVSDALVGAVVDWARAGTHRQLHLWVVEGNQPARVLYTRLGFTETGRRRQALDDPGTTEIEMSLPLISGTSSPAGFRLRVLGPGDEEQFLSVRQRLHADCFTFAKDYDGPWAAYLDRLDRARRGIDLDPGAVASTFLMAEDTSGQIIGSSDIRHELTEQLLHWGGHIGYVVVPDRRRQGVATEILRQTLPLAKDLGISRARMTCRAENLASRRVITACGGELDAITSDGICQYWLPT